MASRLFSCQPRISPFHSFQFMAGFSLWWRSVERKLSGKKGKIRYIPEKTNSKNEQEKYPRKNKAEACYSTSFTFVYVRMNFNMAICIFTTLNKFFFLLCKSLQFHAKKEKLEEEGVEGGPPPTPPVNLWHSVFRICFCLFFFFFYV